MKNALNILRWHRSILMMFLAISSLFVFIGCKENISEDAYAIKTKNTLTDFTSSIDSLSYINTIFGEVKLGISEGAAYLSSVLSSRGNYTVFAPTNAAIQRYIDANIGEGKTLEDLSDEVKERIALNCIIDNGTASAYELSEFPSDTENAAFAISNLNDRRLFCRQDSMQDYIINDTAKVVESNFEASNGYLHIIDQVIVPSNSTLADMIVNADNMHIMGRLLSATGIDTTFTSQYLSNREEQYEQANLAYAGTVQKLSDAVSQVEYRSKRVSGFTGFIETDDVFSSEWGVPEVNFEGGTITNWDEILSVISEKCNNILDPDGSLSSEVKNDITNPENPVNRFVAYHFIEGKAPIEELVHHFNEKGYDLGTDPLNPRKSGYYMNVWDYYTTISVGGQPQALLKITQRGDENDPTNGFYLNRVINHNTDFSHGNYEEVRGTEKTGDGLNVKVEGMNNGVTMSGENSYCYPIKNILINSNDVRTALSSERIRIDVSTMLPELISNDIRGKAVAYFPVGYFTNLLNETSSCRIFYLQNGGKMANGNTAGNYNESNLWKDYQGDEMIISGQYDFVLKLPPVPKTGTYELRMACSNNNLRSMVQVYVGSDPYSTLPIGLPIDQRETVDMIPGDPFVTDEDNSNDETACRESDRDLRNQNYMKAPNYFCNNKGTNTVRNIKGSADDGPALRRILTSQTFDQNKSYYIRFKSALTSTTTQMFLDYFEFVPTSVYNGNEAEDIW